MFNAATLLQSTTISMTFKAGFLLIVTLYLLFLFVILKQIRSMNTIITNPNLFPIIQSSLYLLIAFTVFIFLLGAAIL